ncbi:MAG: 50S ribosomal protein L9 [Chlorobi bacterium]|nr:50S ribosomal protein L9 [Chlorobiota bacterium]
MKVILRQAINNLGDIGDMVVVSDGYARNYLLPKGLAYLASKSSLRVLEEEKKQLHIRQNRELKTAEEIAKQLEKPENSITIHMQTGEEDKLFGSVTKEMIAEKLAEKGFEIDKRKIALDEPIKVLGIYTVPIKLHTNVTAKAKVWVVRQ